MLIVAASTALTAIAFILLGLAALAAFVHAILERQKRLEPVPKHGPLSCNACTSLVAQDIRYTGQKVTCPRCGCNVQAPGTPPSSEAVPTRAVIAAAIGIAIVLLVLGRR
jgi:uncharacterized paraquat-inducible protein A